MPNYRRNRIPGGTYFFTVNLLERKSSLLVDNIDKLRHAVRIVREKQAFFLVPTLLRGHAYSFPRLYGFPRKTVGTRKPEKIQPRRINGCISDAGVYDGRR